MLKIGLTGGISTGKSTVSLLFQNYGVPIIDADVITRKITSRNQYGFVKIVELFGSDCLINGDLNRTYLRSRIFNSDELRYELENLLHPIVRSEIDRQLSKVTYLYCIVVIPLLFEKRFDDLVDLALVVDCPVHLQRSRYIRRDADNSLLFDSILAVQSSRELKVDLTDDILDNSGSAQYLNSQVEYLHSTYLRLSKTCNYL